MSAELLEELITKHGYVVNVTVDADDPLCVMVDFAGKKKAYYRVVTDEEGNVYGVAYWSDLFAGDSAETEEFLPLNISLIRIYILCDIYRQCRVLDLSNEIVRFYTATGDLCEFTELVDVSLEEYEQDVELKLEQVMSDILNKDVDLQEINDELESYGMLHQFNILKSTLV